MTFSFRIQGIDWTVKYGGGLFGWPPRISISTTVGRSTVFVNNGNCPDAQSLAHEFCHVLNTSALRYLVSYTIGRLWRSTYWKDQEIQANTYEVAHKLDPAFVTAANTMMATMPKGTRFETITHTGGLS